MSSRGRQITAWVVVGLGALLLAAAGWVYLNGWPPGPGDSSPTAAPTPAATATPWPTFTPYVRATATPVVSTLRVRCNAPAEVWLTGYWDGQEIARGACGPEERLAWAGLPRTSYNLHARSEELARESQRRVDLDRPEVEVEVAFPGLLLVQPTPGTAAVQVGERTFGGEARLAYGAGECPLTVTVVVSATGYAATTRGLWVEAGRVNAYTVALTPLPTPLPTVVPTAGPTTAPQPTSPPQATQPPAAEWSQEQLQALMYEMWQNFNAVRQENGLPTVDYDEGLQAQANEAARQFYVTDREISREELDAIVAPGWWAYITNQFHLAGGVCGIPPDYNPAWNYTFVIRYANDLNPSVKAITYGFYGPYAGTCGTSITLALIARY